MSSLQVRRPEDVGTPDSEAKGRNHPLYFVGTPRDSLLILMRRVMRTWCDMQWEIVWGQRGILPGPELDRCCSCLSHSQGCTRVAQLSPWITKVSEEPDNDFPVRPVPCSRIGSLVQSSFHMNKLLAYAKSCKYVHIMFILLIHFAQVESDTNLHRDPGTFARLLQPSSLGCRFRLACVRNLWDHNGCSLVQTVFHSLTSFETFWH